MTLLPLQAYDLSAAQKQRQAEVHLDRLIAIYRDGKGHGASSPALAAFVTAVRQAQDVAPGTPLADVIRATYRSVALAFGRRRIDPDSPDFEHELDVFYPNFRANFRLPSEQETKDGFRTLLRAKPRPTGYEERAYSVICPLTGRYLMGLNFTVQPLSDSVHFIYGFVMPCVRGGWGFAWSLITLMRDIAGKAVASYFQRHPADRPSFYNPDGPLILFEKNIIGEMTLTDILMDSAGIDVATPPSADVDLSASGIGQSLRDLVWDRLGATSICYNYIQSSLCGVVNVPMKRQRDAAIRWLNKQCRTPADQSAGELALSDALEGREKGCAELDLCAFAGPGLTSLPALQVRRANEIFQSISVVKDDNIAADIYFQAQMASLADNSRNGVVALDPIRPAGAGAADFVAAEQITRRLLSRVTWDELRRMGERTYNEWLIEKGGSCSQPEPFML